MFSGDRDPLFLLSLPTSLPKAGSWNLSTKPLPSPAAVCEGLSGPVVHVREVGLFPAASLPIAQHQPAALSWAYTQVTHGDGQDFDIFLEYGLELLVAVSAWLPW